MVVAMSGLEPAARRAVVTGGADTTLDDVVLAGVGHGDLPRPGRWVIDPAHSIVRATARHLALSRVEGS